MKKREIEEKLNRIIMSNTPDVLDDVLKECKNKKGIKKRETNNNLKIVNHKSEEEKRNLKKYIPALTGVFVAMFVCFIGVFGFKENNKVDSIIEFDVNPSIEIKINKKEEIINVIGLNEDGKKVLKGMDLEDVDLNVGVNAIIGSMLKNGYITELQNSILISVKNSDKNKAKHLETQISNEIQKIISDKNIESSVLSQSYDTNNEVSKLAKEYNISEGKVNLINKILNSKIKDSKGNAYEFSSLAGLSITELNLLLESKEVNVESVTSKGNSSTKGLIGKEQAKIIALNHAKASNVTKLEVELDTEKGILIYEVEFDFDKKEYEYDINAKTGEIIYSFSEKDDDYIDDKYDDNWDDDDDWDDKYDDDDDDDDWDDKYDDDDDDDDWDDRYDD